MLNNCAAVMLCVYYRKDAVIKWNTPNYHGKNFKTSLQSSKANMTALRQ